MPTDPQLTEVVHRRVFEVQLAEGYQYNPDADFLLVTNANTSLPEWNQWKTLADRLGLTFATWNSSLNNGISLFHELQSRETEGHPAVETDTAPLPATGVHADTGVTLVDHFKDKTIVFLNNDDTCVKTLPPCDFFRSANNGVRSYIVGPNPVREELFYPEKDFAANLNGRARKTVVRNYIHTTNSSEDRLIKAAKKQAKKLQRKWPDKRFIVVYNYEDLPLPRRSLPIVGKYGPKRYQMGTLTSVLSPTNNMFTNLSKQPGESDRSDYALDPGNVYGLLKSLSLQKKIQLVQNNITEDLTEDREALKKAILSDLVDEHKTFRREKWAGGIGKSALKKRLTCLQQVVDASYSETRSKELIQEILIEFRAFAAQMLRDKWYHRRQRKLVTVTNKMIDSFKQKEDIDPAHWLENYKAKKQSFAEIHREDLWRHYQDSEVLPVPQNGLNDPNPVIDFNELQNPYEAVSRVAENSHYFRDQGERLRALEALENGNSNDNNR